MRYVVCLQVVDVCFKLFYLLLNNSNIGMIFWIATFFSHYFIKIILSKLLIYFGFALYLPYAAKTKPINSAPVLRIAVKSPSLTYLNNPNTPAKAIASPM